MAVYDIKIRDIFQNPNFKDMIPQVNFNGRTVYSFAKQFDGVAQYLSKALKGVYTPPELITVVGSKSKILREVRALAGFTESIFNSREVISRNIKKNTTLKMPVSVEQLGRHRSGSSQWSIRQQALQGIVENIQYNDSLGALASLQVDRATMTFSQAQAKWKKKVGL